MVSKGDLEIPAEVTAKIQAACTEGYLSVSVLNGLNMVSPFGFIRLSLNSVLLYTSDLSSLFHCFMWSGASESRPDLLLHIM